MIGTSVLESKYDEIIAKLDPEGQRHEERTERVAHDECRDEHGRGGGGGGGGRMQSKARRRGTAVALLARARRWRCSRCAASARAHSQP